MTGIWMNAVKFTKNNKKLKSKNHTKNSLDHTQTKDMKTGGKGGLLRRKRFSSSGMKERNAEKKYARCTTSMYKIINE